MQIMIPCRFLMLGIALFFILGPSNSLYSQKADSLIVYFDTNQSTLSAIEKNKFIAILLDSSKIRMTDIEVYGFCDDVGSTEYNLELSGKRAKYVKSLLLETGVFPLMIYETSGMGEIPLGNSVRNLDEIRAKNRCVKVHFNYAESVQEKVAEVVQVVEVLEETLLSDSLKIGEILVLEGILFEGGRHQILPESYDNLEKLVKALNDYPNYDFMIQGHICCDHSGLDGFDQDTGIRNLSTARAEAIYKYLVRNGISEDRLQYEGKRADFPTGKGDKFDRRVELLVTGIR